MTSLHRNNLVLSDKLSVEFEDLYSRLNRREYVSPDPLQFLYSYPDVRDREIVGLIASSLAYGNVRQILKSVEIILSQLGESPYDFIIETNPQKWGTYFQNFVHRFAKGYDIVNLLVSIRGVIIHYSSLENALKLKLGSNDKNILPALIGLVTLLNQYSHTHLGHLIPNPGKGSACKRLLLFLRWMIRQDKVDPGGWDLSPSLLLIPLDTHMHYITKGLGMTNRKSADMKMVIQVTNEFSRISPDDPVKYDFSLTRLGIRSELSRDSFIAKCKC